jgi:hypothetical protein
LQKLNASGTPKIERQSNQIFFVELPNGYSNIIEFKLPVIQGSIIKGTENRERFSAELSSFIA